MSLDIVEQIVYDAVDDITSLSVYASIAPQGVNESFVLFNYITSENYMCENNYDILGTKYLFMIECYVDGESFPHSVGEDICGLNGASFTQSGKKVDIKLIRPTSMVDVFEGKEIRRSGGILEFLIR